MRFQNTLRTLASLFVESPKRRMPNRIRSALKTGVPVEANPRVAVRFVRAQLVGKADQEDLEIVMRASTGSEFSIKILRAYLSPVRKPQSDSTFDLEHLIAEGIFFGVDETIRRFTAEELDGSTLSDFWT